MQMPSYRNVEQCLEDEGYEKHSLWSVTNERDRRWRRLEEGDEFSEGEDGWSSSDELMEPGRRVEYWEPPDPWPEFSMSELREQDVETLALRTRSFPKRRGARGQVPREMAIMMEKLKLVMIIVNMTIIMIMIMIVIMITIVIIIIITDSIIVNITIIIIVTLLFRSEHWSARLCSV